MKRLHVNQASALHTALMLSLLLIPAAAILLFFVLMPAAKDRQLHNLLSAVIPRFFICIFLLTLAIEFFPDSLRFRRVSAKNLLWCVLPLLVALVNFPFSALIGGEAQITRISLLGLFLLKCLLIGIGEEVLFRGIVFCTLLQSFQKKKGALLWPVFLSSLIFALFHLINLFDGMGILSVLQQIGYSFLIGAMLAAVLFKTDNLWVCVFLHVLFDVGGLLIFDLGIGNPQDLIFWILTIAVGVLCAVHIIITLIKQQKRLLL